MKTTVTPDGTVTVETGDQPAAKSATWDGETIAGVLVKSDAELRQTLCVAYPADRADVADGTVYLYFKSKEEILMTAINTAFDAFMSLARTELKKLSDPVERLRRLAQKYPRSGPRIASR